jgi:hypothetical protein
MLAHVTPRKRDVRKLFPNMETVTFFLSDCSISWMCRLLVTDALPYSCFRLSLFFQSSSPLFFNSANLDGKCAKKGIQRQTLRT